VRYVQSAPPPALADFVTCLWGLESSVGGTAAVERSVQRILPDGRAEIIFHLADPFREVDTGVTQVPALTAGQLTRAISVRPGGRVRTVAIRLTPAGARAVLATPHHLLTDTVTPLDAVNRRLAVRLSSVLSDTAPLESVLDALAGALGMEPLCPPRAEAMAAVRFVDERAGLLTVDDVCAGAGRSPRTLERIFLDLAGVPPRLYLRLVRFRHAVREAEAKMSRRWTDVALACGYYDHAHFTRDFRSFAGCAPSAWLDSNERDLTTWFCAAGDPSVVYPGASPQKESQP
jgi:AraC-like DNA-binding protein